MAGYKKYDLTIEGESLMSEDTKSITIWAMADIHTDWMGIMPAEWPEADVCVIAGDLTGFGIFGLQSVNLAASYMSRIARKMPILWIPGNHDFGMDGKTFADRVPNSHCLLDGPYKIKGVRFAGISVCSCEDLPSLAYTWCHTTADEDYERKQFYALPECDVLVSHNPPFKTLDKAGYDLSKKEMSYIGSKPLREMLNLWEWYPQAVICGHAHNNDLEYVFDHGKGKSTTVYNVAQKHHLFTVTLQDQ